MPHNLNYWWFGDYLGLGAGAHGKITWPDRIEREARTRAPADYLRRAAAGDALAERRVIEPAGRVFEFMMNALRLPAGFPEKLLTARTGLPLAAAEPGLSQGLERGLLDAQPRRDTADRPRPALPQRSAGPVPG